MLFYTASNSFQGHTSTLIYDAKVSVSPDGHAGLTPPRQLFWGSSLPQCWRMAAGPAAQRSPVAGDLPWYELAHIHPYATGMWTEVVNSVLRHPTQVIFQKNPLPVGASRSACVMGLGPLWFHDSACVSIAFPTAKSLTD
jgi:hypothetical protein